jgi:hypothetical protein
LHGLEPKAYYQYGTVQTCDGCDGCDARFTLQHALGYKKGGLVIFRHNEIREEQEHMAEKAMNPLRCATNPSFALVASQ